ncbi:MAG TPA: GAF domain-containing protein [Thermoanaerobaculia bacterium]|nr:GAF domain-containing protein [Thermoanaerobaculia bacterium]
MSKDLKVIKSKAALAGKGEQAAADPAPRATQPPGRSGEASRLRHAELMLEVTRRMAVVDSLDDVLYTLVALTTTQIGAERGSLFLNDESTGELYSRAAQGTSSREIRLLNTNGIAGTVFQTGKGLIIHDAYADPRFNREIDEQTGYETRSIVCVPIRTVQGALIGVAQAVNKIKGKFTRADMELLTEMTAQGAIALQNAQNIERMEAIRKQEKQFLDMVSEMTADIKIGSLLQKVMSEATRMLDAERSTLFLNDEQTGELWSQVSQGLDSAQIRLPNHAGIAGLVFTSGKSINIPYAYADLRFNPAFDRKTGFFTRSILCVPVVNQQGKVIGVTQVLNKRSGPFGPEDEQRLKAFTAQVAIALENAKLFADVQAMKNYNDNMLESMSNGVITLDEMRHVVTCNTSGLRILRRRLRDIIQRPAEELFQDENEWVIDKVKRVTEAQAPESSLDRTLAFEGEKVSVNLTILPLKGVDGKALGTMILLDDISSEKRVRATMSRYMDANIADQLLLSGADLLGGQAITATVLFSDIRGFTGLTENLGAAATVSLLNEYFTLMVETIQEHGGMLDKFIGDAIMAGFGVPVPQNDDEDRAVRAAIRMIAQLAEWNAKRVSEGKLPVHIGIGLNTDSLIAGNIGSLKRMDFTMIGDGVNLASRLESACKQYGAQILVSENTFKRLRGTYRARLIDNVIVKGKTQSVSIYEILDYHDDVSFPALADFLQMFRLGMDQYRGRKFKEAISTFTETLGLREDDKVSKMYLDRCRHYLSEPPPQDWSGIWTLSEK